jgi:hypothetical protein
MIIIFILKYINNARMFFYVKEKVNWLDEKSNNPVVSKTMLKLASFQFVSWEVGIQGPAFNFLLIKLGTIKRLNAQPNGLTCAPLSRHV